MKKILIIICSILILIVFLVSCGNSNFSSIQSCIFYDAGVDDCSTLVSSKNKYGIKEIVEDAKKYEYPDSKENTGLVLDDSDNISAFKDLGNAFIALSDKSKYKITGYKYLIARQSDSLIYALQDSSNATKASRSSFAIYFQSKTNSIFVAESVNKALKKVDLRKSIYNVFDDNTIAVYPFMGQTKDS